MIPRGSDAPDIVVTDVRVNDAAASQRFPESRSRSQNDNSFSMNRSAAPSPPSIFVKASTRGPDDRNAQRNRPQSSSFDSNMVANNPQVHSSRPPIASFLHRAQKYAQAAMHRVRSPSPVDDTRKGKRRHRWRALQTLPAAVRRPHTTRSGRAQRNPDRRAQRNPDITQEEPSDRFKNVSSSHSSSRPSMSAAPAVKVPMFHKVHQAQTSNQQPDYISATQKSCVYGVSSGEDDASYRTEDSSGDEQPRSTHTSRLRRRYIVYSDSDSSILRPLRTMDNPSTVVGSRAGVGFPSSRVPELVNDSTDSNSSANKKSPMGTQTQPTRDPASPIPTPNLLTDAHGRNGAKSQTLYSEGSESDVSMEYECHAPVIDIDMDHDTTDVQNSGDSGDEESSVGSSSRVSVHREESPLVIHPPGTLRVPLFKVASNMPIPLPKTPCARGRRLLIPSKSTKPIAWVSMRGDMQFIDGISQ